ncbi:MAG TPA: glycosyltransferase family 4 protein, partial [Victivallales bacterium]|nr:glycosyltransferase family 4 protein [Victivallales bacterium]
MKIAVIKKDYLCNGGGAERYAMEICRRLTIAGHQVYVHSRRFVEDRQTGIIHVPVRQKVFGAFSSTHSFHKSVQKVISPGDYDVIYSLSRTYPTDVHRVTESLHCEWMKIRYSPFQLFNPRHIEILSLEKDIFKIQNTRYVVCNSELTKKQIIKNYEYPEEKIYVIRNGVNKEEFYPASDHERINLRRKLDLNKSNFVILFAASNFRIKGLDFAMKALVHLPEILRKQVILLVAGGGRADYFRKIAQKLNVNDNIRFLGYVASMRELYVSSDILLHPVLYEPFANVCIEALACGLPVITTRNNGASE